MGNVHANCDGAVVMRKCPPRHWWCLQHLSAAQPLCLPLETDAASDNLLSSISCARRGSCLTTSSLQALWWRSCKVPWAFTDKMPIGVFRTLRLPSLHSDACYTRYSFYSSSSFWEDNKSISRQPGHFVGRGSRPKADWCHLSPAL